MKVFFHKNVKYFKFKEKGSLDLQKKKYRDKNVKLIATGEWGGDSEKRGLQELL